MQRRKSIDGTSFYKKFQLFGMAALACHKAEYLLRYKNRFKFNEEQLEAIAREHHVASLYLQLEFDELIELGIPSEMLPIHLQVDSKDNNKTKSS